MTLLSRLQDAPNVYVVFREAVYRHACAGVYSSLNRAMAVADEMAKKDADDHHSYKVVPFFLDVKPIVSANPDAYHSSPPIPEQEPVYVARKRVSPCLKIS